MRQVVRGGSSQHPGTAAEKALHAAVSNISTARRLLLVDLNRFAHFPTLAVGLLVAGLRSRGHGVHVLCPLAHGAPGVQREGRETWVDHVLRRIHLSDSPYLIEARDLLRALRRQVLERPHPVVLREVRKALHNRPEAILLSAYLEHFNTVREIGAMAAAKQVPVLLGGPMFNVSGVAEAWHRLPGLAGVVGAEADLNIADLIEMLCAGGRIGHIPGVVLPDGSRSRAAPPLRDLDAVPVPDFTDFPWNRYSARIVPLMTGRGCQWNKCSFCSDVVSASGRTFRTRSVENVLMEMEEQARRHETTNFLFLDLKLNSHPDMFRGIAEGARRHVAGAEWIGTVHVDRRRDNGLRRQDLFAAVAGGMRRISFGLESGSQRLLDRMCKGSFVEANSEFIRNAYEAGLSVRCTMFKGYPGETAEDMEATARFLEAHSPYLDRIRFNDFSLQHDTPIFNAVMKHGGEIGRFAVHRVDDRRARTLYRNPEAANRSYRRAKARVLSTVFEINRRPLRDEARQFDGLM